VPRAGRVSSSQPSENKRKKQRNDDKSRQMMTNHGGYPPCKRECIVGNQWVVEYQQSVIDDIPGKGGTERAAPGTTVGSRPGTRGRERGRDGRATRPPRRSPGQSHSTLPHPTWFETAASRPPHHEGFFPVRRAGERPPFDPLSPHPEEPVLRHPWPHPEPPAGRVEGEAKGLRTRGRLEGRGESGSGQGASRSTRGSDAIAPAFRPPPTHLFPAGGGGATLRRRCRPPAMPTE